MPTLNEKRRATLVKRKDKLEGMKLPIDREIFFIESQIELIDQFEAAEAHDAQEKLGLNNEEAA